MEDEKESDYIRTKKENNQIVGIIKYKQVILPRILTQKTKVSGAKRHVMRMTFKKTKQNNNNKKTHFR